MIPENIMELFSESIIFLIKMAKNPKKPSLFLVYEENHSIF